MSECHVEPISMTPYLDMEFFMQLADMKRMEGDLFSRLTDQWEVWVKELRVLRVKAGKIEYLLVALGEKVEQDVDASWDESPHDGFMLNALAQTMLMCVIREVVPEVAEAGCAPVPKPTDALREALMDEGCAWQEDFTLERRFAMLTHFPFKGGCEICALGDMCPKKQGPAPTVNLGTNPE